MDQIWGCGKSGRLSGCDLEARLSLPLRFLHLRRVGAANFPIHSTTKFPGPQPSSPNLVPQRQQSIRKTFPLAVAFLAMGTGFSSASAAIAPLRGR